MSNTARTRCHRHAESKNPANVIASAAKKKVSVPACVSFGSRLPAGILVTRNASSAALTSSRSPTFT